jgi:hypothetical protein
MIYTSYFAKIRKFPNTLVPVSIARFNPNWYSGQSYPKLAPSRTLLTDYKNGKVSEIKYREIYMNQLEQLDPNVVNHELWELTAPLLERQNGAEFDGNVYTLDEVQSKFGIVLVCYEPVDKFCHRHIVTEWFTKHNIQCEELLI